jgi:DNA-binding response OmpR family regulator
MDELTQHLPLRVLVVDDNRDAADSLSVLLQLWGHEARVAYDGAEGLRAALEFRPQVALLDVQMPLMHGGQLAQALGQLLGPEGVVLVATSATDPEDARLDGYAPLFDHYLLKPYNLARLEALLAGCAAQAAR